MSPFLMTWFSRRLLQGGVVAVGVFLAGCVAAPYPVGVSYGVTGYWGNPYYGDFRIDGAYPYGYYPGYVYRRSYRPYPYRRPPYWGPRPHFRYPGPRFGHPGPHRWH